MVKRRTQHDKQQKDMAVYRSFISAVKREVYELQVFGRPSELRYEMIIGRLKDAVKRVEAVSLQK